MSDHTGSSTLDPNNFSVISEEMKDPSSKSTLNKFRFELYHEEDDVQEKIIRVKRISLPNKGEKWKIFEDNKVIHTIEGIKLNKKEKEFLRSVAGANWLLTKAKTGIKSFNSFKKDLKMELSPPKKQKKK